MASANPYAAPRASVEDVQAQRGADGRFVAEGVVVPASHGWLWLKLGFVLFKRQPGAWIAIVLVWALLSVLLQIIPFIGAIASMLITPIFTAGFMLGTHALDADEPLTVGHLFAGFKTNAGQLALLGLLQVVGIFLIVGVTMVPMMLLGGGADFGAPMVVAMLLFAVAIILFVKAIWFAPAIIAIEGASAFEAIGASFRGAIKNWRAFLLYGLIGLVMLAVIGVIFAAVVGVGGVAMFVGVAGGGNLAGMLGAMAVGLIFMLALAATLGPIVIASIYAGFRDIFYES